MSADDVSISLQVDLDEALASRPKPVSARLMICELFLKRKSQPRNEANSSDLIMIVLVVGTIMAGFVSPEIGKQIDRGLQLAGFETSALHVKTAGSPLSMLLTILR